MPKKHTLESFDDDLAHFRGEAVSLGDLAEMQLEHAIAALLNDDIALAQEAIGSDEETDRKLQRVNGYMSIVRARQQAVAGDLREILAAGRIAAHLGRLAEEVYLMVTGMPLLGPRPKLNNIAPA